MERLGASEDSQQTREFMLGWDDGHHPLFLSSLWDADGTLGRFLPKVIDG
jgi:hypothetical protein